MLLQLTHPPSDLPAESVVDLEPLLQRLVHLIVVDGAVLVSEDVPEPDGGNERVCSVLVDDVASKSNACEATCLARSEHAWIAFSTIRSTARCSVVSFRSASRESDTTPLEAVVTAFTVSGSVGPLSTSVPLSTERTSLGLERSVNLRVSAPVEFPHRECDSVAFVVGLGCLKPLVQVPGFLVEGGRGLGAGRHLSSYGTRCVPLAIVASTGPEVNDRRVGVHR